MPILINYILYVYSNFIRQKIPCSVFTTIPANSLLQYFLSESDLSLQKVFLNRVLFFSVFRTLFEGGVAGYGNRMRVKYTAKWGLQIAEMIFQTRSNRTGHFLTAVFLYKIMKTLGFFCAVFLASFDDFRFKNCYTWNITLYYMLLEVFTNESQKL